MTTPDLEVLDDDDPDVLAVEDTEPVVLEEVEDIERDEALTGQHLDESCGCDDPDDDVQVTPEDDD